MLFTSPEEGCGAGASCGASKVGELIYQNDHAVVAAYRRPGNPPAIGALQVNRLVAE